MASSPALASLSHLSDAKRSERAALEASIAFFEHCIDAVLYTAPDGRILDANEAAVELLRMPSAEICRRGRFGLADPNDPRWETAVEERARTGRFMGPLSFRRGDDTFVECVISSSIFPNHDGELRAIVVMREATPTTTDDVRPEHRLVDRETGVYTRPAFVVVVEQQCRIALRDQSGLVLLYIDLVEQGASAASRRPFANMLTSLCRRGDLVARLGRDEFAILVREESRRGASALVDRIRARLDDPDEGDEVRDLHVHVGITTIDPSAGVPIERLLDDVTRMMRDHRARELAQPLLPTGSLCTFALPSGPESTDEPGDARAALLTDRERTVLRLLASRRTYAEIARELYVSLNTVKSHVAHIYAKLGATGRADAVSKARDLELQL